MLEQLKDRCYEVAKKHKKLKHAIWGIYNVAEQNVLNGEEESFEFELANKDIDELLEENEYQ